LPAPPTVTLPQQTTGTGALHPGRAIRLAVRPEVIMDSGHNARASRPSCNQKDGAAGIVSIKAG
jgi:hypothetical protein